MEKALVKMRSFIVAPCPDKHHFSNAASGKVPHMHVTFPLKLLKMWRQGRDTGNFKAALFSFFLFLFPLSLSGQTDRQTDRELRETVTQLNQDYNPEIQDITSVLADQPANDKHCAVHPPPQPPLLFQGNWWLYWTSQGQKLWHTGAFWEKRAQCCRHCCSHGCDKGNADSELVLFSPRGAAEGWRWYECFSLFFHY